VARELIARADVVVENFSAGVMKKYDLDYASVAPGNPRLVYCSILAMAARAVCIPTRFRSDNAGEADSCRSTAFLMGHRCGPGHPRSTW